jgi:hypothetical protein
MKKTTLLFLTTAFAAITITANPLYAAMEHEHGHDSDKGHDQDMNSSMSHDMHGSDMNGMFLVKKNIDGYDVSFHVMEAQKGMEHGGSHNFMIKVEQHGKALGNVKINSKVIHPDSKAESKALMKMGDWYMNGYDLGHKGKYQLMILFKTADGKKHKGGIYYPGK